MPLPGDRLYANSIWIGPANADNFMVGRSGYGIYGSVQHHSAGTLQALIYRFTHPPAISGGGASAHFAIDREEETRDGLLGFGQYAIRYQLVDTADMAFADANYWENLTTVAVEHVREWGSGPGTPGYEPITDAQYRSSHELQLILSADNGYPLNSTTITPHNAYAQTTCPGDLVLNRVITGEGGPEVLDPNDPAYQGLLALILGGNITWTRHVNPPVGAVYVWRWVPDIGAPPDSLLRLAPAVGVQGLEWEWALPVAETGGSGTVDLSGINSKLDALAVTVAHVNSKFSA